MIVDVECVCVKCGFTTRKRTGRCESLDLKDVDLNSPVGGDFFPKSMSIDVLIEENRRLYNNYFHLEHRLLRLLMRIESISKFKEGIDDLKSSVCDL